MDAFLKMLQSPGGQAEPLAVREVLLALALSLVCSIVLCFVYRFTHRSASYSQSYVHALVVMGLVTTLIMIVIGSNIARAFSLVGALSIIRFRNAVKETRDVAYIFMIMAIAMACGTRFYGVAILSTAILSSVTLVMHFVNFGSSKRPPERLLLVQLPPGLNAETALEPVLRKLFESFSFVSMESVRQGLYTEVLLSVVPKSNVTGSQVLEQVALVNGNLKVNYNYSAQSDDL
ncbi:MAG TPA: DUF4956 domain-containing protein [Planctomycetota bacterium]|nr:DUF4956 domain-containing protein [Planctomycetota bacterium]